MDTEPGRRGGPEIPRPPRLPSPAPPAAPVAPGGGGAGRGGSGAERRPASIPPAPRNPAAGRSVPPPRSEPAAPRRLYLALAPAGDGDDEELGPPFPEHAWSERAFLINAAQVRRAQGDRPVLCDAGELALRKGDSVVVESERGLELALVVAAPRRALVEARPPLRALRRAGEADLAAEARTRLREAEAVRAARLAVAALNLPAKVVRAEIGLGGGRTTVYIASEERIELRELARRLSATLRGRIDLRHVGMRDAARVTGGVGPCGLQLCCNTFLSDFAPVSIRMAKDQGLALNPQRVSGVCGRLMCCLVYEDAFYRAQRQLFPKQGKQVHTPRGDGRVRDVDVLGRSVRVAFPDGSVASFDVEEVRPVHGGGGERAPALPPTGGEPPR